MIASADAIVALAVMAAAGAAVRGLFTLLDRHNTFRFTTRRR